MRRGRANPRAIRQFRSGYAPTPESPFVLDSWRHRSPSGVNHAAPWCAPVAVRGYLILYPDEAISPTGWARPGESADSAAIRSRLVPIVTGSADRAGISNPSASRIGTRGPPVEIAFPQVRHYCQIRLLDCEVAQRDRGGSGLGRRAEPIAGRDASAERDSGTTLGSGCGRRLRAGTRRPSRGRADGES